MKGGMQDLRDLRGADSEHTGTLVLGHVRRREALLRRDLLVLTRLAGLVDGVAVAVEAECLLLLGQARGVLCSSGVVAVDHVAPTVLRLNVIWVWLRALVVFGLRGVVVVVPEK